MYREPQQESKNKVFGMAEDYYRVRVLKMDEELPADLEWRDDILYRAPKAYPSKLKVTYRLQLLTRENAVHETASLRDKREVKNRLKAIREDLRELSKMKFDEKYGIEDISADIESLKELQTMFQEKTIFFTGVHHSKKH